MVCESVYAQMRRVIPLKKLNVSLSFFLVLFGVCSVSLEAHSYPVSRFHNDSDSFSQDSNSTPPTHHQLVHTQSFKMTRSAREDVSSGSGPLTPGTHNLSLGVGQIFLMGDLSDKYKNAIGTQLNYTYGVSDLFDFESTFGYSSHSNGDLSLAFLSMGLRSNLIYFDKLIPFFNVDLGFYRPDETVSNDVSVNALLFGLQLGGGIDLLISNKVFFGTRLAFHDMFSSTKDASDGHSYDVGGSFLSFMIHVGVNL